MAKQAHDKRTLIVRKPQGYVVLRLKSGDVNINLDFNAVADADAHLGKACVQAFVEDPMNLNTLRVLFFYGIREDKPEIKDVRDAGRLLKGATLETISNAIITAMEVSGMIKPEDLEQLDRPADAGDGETAGE